MCASSKWKGHRRTVPCQFDGTAHLMHAEYVAGWLTRFEFMSFLDLRSPSNIVSEPHALSTSSSSHSSTSPSSSPSSSLCTEQATQPFLTVFFR